MGELLSKCLVNVLVDVHNVCQSLTEDFHFWEMLPFNFQLLDVGK